MLRVFLPYCNPKFGGVILDELGHKSVSGAACNTAQDQRRLRRGNTTEAVAICLVSADHQVWPVPAAYRD